MSPFRESEGSVISGFNTGFLFRCSPTPYQTTARPHELYCNEVSSRIIADLRDERDQLNEAILALERMPFHVLSAQFLTNGGVTPAEAGQALREIRRVLRRGGLVALTAWGPLEQNTIAVSPL